MLKSKETQFPINKNFPNIKISNNTGIHKKCVCVCVCVCVCACALFNDTVNCYDSIMPPINPTPCLYLGVLEIRTLLYPGQHGRQ